VLNIFCILTVDSVLVSICDIDLHRASIRMTATEDIIREEFWVS